MRSLFSSASSALSQASERTLQNLEKTKEFVGLHHYSEAKVKSIVANSSLPIRIAGTIWKRRGGVSGKLASYSSAWERRFVILKGNYLLYFESSIQANQHPSAQSVRGILDVPAEQASVQPSMGHDTGAPSPFCLNIQVPTAMGGVHETKWKLCFDSHALLMEWMAHLTDVIVQASVDQYNQALLEMANPNSVFFQKSPPQSQSQSKQSSFSTGDAVIGSASTCTTAPHSTSALPISPMAGTAAAAVFLQPPPVYEPTDTNHDSSDNNQKADTSDAPLSSPTTTHRLWMTESYRIQSPSAAAEVSSSSFASNPSTKTQTTESNDQTGASLDHQNALHVMQTLLSEKEKTRLSLDQQVRDLTQRTGTLELQLEQTRQQLEHAIVQNSDAPDYATILEEKEAELEALAHAKELENQQVKALRREVEELKISRTSMQETNDRNSPADKNNNERMDVDHEHTIQVLQEQVAALEADKQSLASQLEECQATLTEYETELATAREDQESLTALLLQKESEMESLQIAAQEYKKASEDAQRDKSVLEKVLEMLKANLQEKDTQIQQLTQAKIQAEQGLAPLEAKLHEQEGKLTESTHRITELHSEIEALTKQHQESVAEHTQTMTRLQSQLDESRKDAEILRVLHQAKDRTVDSLTREVDELKSRLAPTAEETDDEDEFEDCVG